MFFFVDIANWNDKTIGLDVMPLKMKQKPIN